VKILYVSQYFPPETGAGARRAYEMASAWRAAGHDVTVVCPFPNYPAGQVHADYRGKLRVREEIDGIPVLRVPIYASAKKSFLRRLSNYASFSLSGAVAALGQRKPDVIYVSSPPLPVGLSGLLARYKGARFFFEVRDLWPESARALGELNNPAAYRAAEWFELSCYRAAEKIVVVTRGIYDRLVERGIPAEKLLFAPNGANLATLGIASTPIPHGRERLEIFYGGLLGLAQGIPSIIESLKLLQDENSFRLRIAGAGPFSGALEEAVRRGLRNVEVLGNLPANEIPPLIREADICLVPLAKDPLFRGALPSKTFEAWACGRPVLLSAAGEAARLVAETRGGVIVPPEDPGALAEAIHWLAKNRQSIVEMGDYGQKAVQRFDRRAIANDLLRAMEKAA
jgi:glycosyltransferase involved in cell wall biosynthesis